IVDASGNLKLSARDDGTSPHTVEVARKKAYTALIYRRPSMDTAKAWATQVPPPSIEGTIALGGGFPIRAGDQVVGAIGVSGAPGQDKDEACANAGLAPVVAQSPAPAVTQPPIAGTWKLNPEKSGAKVPPDYVEIHQYRLRAD